MGKWGKNHHKHCLADYDPHANYVNFFYEYSIKKYYYLLFVFILNWGFFCFFFCFFYTKKKLKEHPIIIHEQVECNLFNKSQSKRWF
jgi:uncharacterized protein YneF (UPF0154 family)